MTGIGILQRIKKECCGNRKVLKIVIYNSAGVMVLGCTSSDCSDKLIQSIEQILKVFKLDSFFITVLDDVIKLNVRVLL